MNDLFTKTDYSLYSNAMTFVRRPYVRDPIDVEADVVVLGVPLDMATSGRPGARMGPDAIRKASVNLAWESKKFPWDFSLFDRIDVIDSGDLVFDCGDAEDFCEFETCQFLMTASHSIFYELDQHDSSNDVHSWSDYKKLILNALAKRQKSCMFI